MTEVLFFFDTEDYVNEASTDAAMRLAQILTQENVTGHFAVVGLLAKRMMETGRQDAIEALNRHEIGSHTYGHSLHPTICELSEGADFGAAYERVAQSEGEGLRLIRKAFHRNEILFAVPPGNSKSYVSLYCIPN